MHSIIFYMLFLGKHLIFKWNSFQNKHKTKSNVNLLQTTLVCVVTCLLRSSSEFRGLVCLWITVFDGNPNKWVQKSYFYIIFILFIYFLICDVFHNCIFYIYIFYFLTYDVFHNILFYIYLLLTFGIHYTDFILFTF